MKKTRCLLFCCVLLSLSCTAQSSQWSISGSFQIPSEAPQSLQLRAFTFPDESFRPIAQIVVGEDGQFHWSAPFQAGNLYELSFGEQQLRLAVDSSEQISVTFKRKAEQWRPVIQGSRGTTKMYQFPQQVREREAFYFGKLKQRMEKAVQEKDEATLAEIQLKVSESFPKFVGDLEALLADLGPSTALYGALDYIDSNKGQAMIEQSILRLQAEKPQWPVTKALVERLARMKGIPVGATAPDFTATSLSQNTVQLSDYRGKYLYIDFWASWCLACRAENPILVKLYQEYQSEQFDMLGVGVKDKETAWKAAIRKDQLRWTQINDTDNRIAATYFVMSLPQNLLLDPAGKILRRNMSSDELQQFLAALAQKEN